MKNVLTLEKEAKTLKAAEGSTFLSRYKLQFLRRNAVHQVNVNTTYVMRARAQTRLALSELKSILQKVAEKDLKSEKTEIEEGLERYESLILQIAKYGKADFLAWVEGTEIKEFEKQEKDLNLLERGNLIRGEMKYTERDAYLECTLTETGAELAKKLLRWNWR